MAEVQEIRHYQVNARYRIVIERIGSAKGTLGFKVEANGDDISVLQADIVRLKAIAESEAGMITEGGK